MTRAHRAWAINRGGKNSVRNLLHGPRTRLVRGMHTNQQAIVQVFNKFHFHSLRARFSAKFFTSVLRMNFQLSK